VEIKKEEYEFINFYTRFLYDESQGIFIIIFSGSMDKQPVLELQEKIGDLISKRKFNFIIDLSNVTYISSTGLGFLMYIMKFRKNFIFLSSPPEDILKAFKLLDMDDLFMFYYNPTELKERAGVSDEIINLLEKETSEIKTIHYKNRWVRIFRENFATYGEAAKEIKKILPYILQAENADSISIPSDEKYTCVLYKFLDKVIRKKANINSEEIDDTLVELAAKELITNAIKHAYDYNKDGIIEINYKIDNKQLEIDVIDYGKGFSPQKSSGSLRPSAGLQLLKKIFNNVEIDVAPKSKKKGLILGKGTTIRLIKSLK